MTGTPSLGLGFEPGLWSNPDEPGGTMDEQSADCNGDREDGGKAEPARRRLAHTEQILCGPLVLCHVRRPGQVIVQSPGVRSNVRAPRRALRGRQ